MANAFMLAGSALSAAFLAAGAAQAYTYPVKVTDYGALCDGSTDDTDKIIAAITAAQAGAGTAVGGGATVLFPAGTCVINATAKTIALNDVALVGAEVPHFSDADAVHILEAGTVISVGKSNAAPSASIPAFSLGHSVTIRGINIIYPYQIAKGLVSGTPVPAATTFTDLNSNGTSNILFDNVHVIGSYDFWVQNQSPSPTYGNIRFTNTDIYAIRKVFDWSNVQESVVFSNFISNPSLCNGGSGGCSDGLKNWTADNGIWFHVGGGTSTTGKRTAVGGLQANNLTVASYKTGILVDSNGHLDEALMASSTVLDGVPYILYVNSNGSITHTVFSGKAEFGGTSRSGTGYSNAAFTLNNPQFPLSTDPIQDHNTLSLNGFTADGLGGPLLSATVTTGDIGSVTLTGVTVRHYCDGPAVTNAIDLNTPNNATQSTAIIIVGSQITTNRNGCGGVGGTTTGAPYINANNLIGYYPLN